MDQCYERRLALLQQQGLASTLRGIRRGLEKESLRITPRGRLAQTPHPPGLGSALTNPYITTDFSEALLEFITPPLHGPVEVLDFLDAIHRFTYRHLGDEILWAASMPCILESDDEIPIAHYGISNVGRMKTVYRMGLANRYGRSMQTIAGIHYNFSLPEELWAALAAEEGAATGAPACTTASYFHLIRNFHRYSWLLLYLYGAAPALCKTFLHGRAHNLEELPNGTLYKPWATSLRMGDLGYTSSAQREMQVNYNDLESYLRSLHAGLTTPHPHYAGIPVVDEAGNYRQLSTSLLQIENEYYSTIRPKQVTHPGETPIKALRSRGVQYVEIRALDVNPFLPLGIDRPQMDFMDVFLVFCALASSPRFADGDYRQVRHNLDRVIDAGRDPALQLLDGGQPRLLREWAAVLLDAMLPVAEMLDGAGAAGRHREALALQVAKVENAELTPSASILRRLSEQDTSFFRLAFDLSRQHKEQFLATPLPAGMKQMLENAANRSLQDQAAIEHKDSIDFAGYLQNYFRQYQELGW